jgi:hypothetical protein
VGVRPMSRPSFGSGGGRCCPARSPGNSTSG